MGQGRIEMRGMAGKPISQSLRQSPTDVCVALNQQVLHFMHRLEHRVMLFDMTVAWRKFRFAHPGIFFSKMSLQMHL